MNSFQLGESRRARASALVEATRRELLRAAPDILTQFPLETYIDALDLQGAPVRYYHTSEAFRNLIATMDKTYPASVIELYNRLLLAHLILDSEKRNKHNIIPSVVEFVHEDLDRILSGLERPRAGYFQRSVTMFRHDLAIARMKVIPNGAEFLDTNVGIGRSHLIRDSVRGLRGAFNCWRTFNLELVNGLWPVYEPHWDRRYFRHFSPEGYKAFYLRTADMMRANPEVRGFYAASWWYDPGLVEVSPELAFLRALPEEGGAYFLQSYAHNPYLATEPFAGSQVRKAMHEAGRYNPRTFIMYWSRARLLRWASSQANS